MNTFHELFKFVVSTCFIGHVYIDYRVTVVVSDVGWVDTDFGSSLDGGTQLQLPSQIDGASHIMSTQPRSMTTMVTL